MAGNVDNRVVQMRFENRQFERNIAKSKKSLEELKASMNFDETSKGMRRFAESMDSLRFNTLEENIQKLADKFTGLGTIGELVVSQIRRKIEEASRSVSGFVESMTTAQIGAGKSKFEMLNKSVQTIKAATGETEATVYSVLKRLNDYTDQTSYNFADMAQNIGKFTSVGIDLRAAERQMEGIANWAARSGAGIAEASRAMYNLSQAMGVGKLTKIDWKSIENASMATKEFKEQLIAAAVEAGTLVEKAGKYYTKNGGVEVNYKNVADTLAKGWATNTVVSATLEKYYWDDLLYQQEETFNEMLANDKKISSSEWKTLSNQKFATDELKQALIDAAVEQGNLVKTVENGKPVYKTAAKYGKEIEVSLENIAETLDVGWLDNLVSEKGLNALGGLAQESYKAAQKCLTFSDVLGAWKDQISTGWMNTYTHIFGELSESMEHFSDICNAVAETIDKLITFRNKLLEGWADLGGRKSLWSTLLGSFASDAEEGAYGILDVFNSVGEIVSKGFWDLLKLFAPGDIQSLWDENDGAWRMAWLKVSLMETTDALKDFVAGIRDFFNEEIKVGDSVKTRGQMIQETVLIFASAVKMVYDVVEGFIGFFVTIGTQLGDSFDAILGFLSELGLSFYDSANAVGKAKVIPQFFSEVAEILKPVTSAINGVIKTITELLSSFFKSGDATNMSKSLFGVIGEYLKKFFSFISNTAAPMIEFIGDLIGVLKDLFSGGFGEENLAKTGKALTNALKRMLKGLPQSIQKIVKFFKTLYENITNVIKNRFSPQSRKQLTEQVGGAVTGIVESLPAELQTQGKNIIDKIGEFFKNIWDKITGFFKGEQVKDGEPKESLLDRVVGWLRDGYNSVVTYIQTMVGNLEGTAASFGTALKNLNWSKILMYLFGGLAVAGIATIVAKAVSVVKTASKAVQTVCDILTGKKGIMPRLFQVEEKAEGFSDKVLKISEAIGILAAAMILIGNMELGDAIQGGVALIVLLGLLVGVSALMTKVYKGTDWEEAVGIVGVLIGMTVMGLAVARLAKVILPIANMEWDDVIKMIFTLGVIFGGLIWLATLSKDGNMSAKSMGGVAAVAGAVAILMYALKGIADMKPDQIWTMLKTLFAMLLEFIGFVWAVQKASLGGKGLGQLAAVAGAIAILVFSLKSIANMDLTQLATMFGSLFVILTELWLFIKLSKGTSLSGKGLTQLIALAGAIAILMIALLPLCLVPIGQLMTAVLGIFSIMAMMFAFTKLTKSDTLMGSGLPQLLALAGAVVLITIALLPLCLIPLDKLAVGIGAVLLIIGSLIGMMAVIGHNKSDNWKSMVALIAVAGAVALLATALMPLALMEWGPLIKMGAALIVLMGSLIGLVKVTQKASAKSILSAAVLMGVMSFMILAFGTALHTVKDVKWELVATFAGGLAAIIGLITLAIFALKDVDLAKGLKVILFLAAGVAALGLVISLLAPMLIRGISGGLRDAAGDIAIISDLMQIISDKMGNVNEGGFDKVGRIIEKIVSLIGMMIQVAFKAGSTSTFMFCMAQLVLAADEMTKFDQRVQKLSADGGTGKLISIVEGYEIAFTDHLSKFGTYLGYSDNFYSALYKLGSGFDYFESMTKNRGNAEDNQGLQLIKQLAGCASDLDTIYKMDLDRFKTQLGELGGAMILYAQGANAVSGEEITKDTNVGGAVILLKKISESLSQNGGFTIPENMPKDSELSAFGIQLAALAGALVAFEQAGQGLGSGTQQALATLDFFVELKAKLLAMAGFGEDLNSAINSFKGENGEFIKKDELTTFGEDIAQLGSSMAYFAKSTQYVDQDTNEIKPIDFTKATEALESIAGLNEKLPRLGGALTAVRGENQTLSALATHIELLGTSLKKFHESTTIANNGVPEAMDFSNAESFLKSIVDMEGMLSTIKLGGIPSLFEGDEMTFGTLGSQLIVLGSGLHILSDSISGETDGKPNFDKKAIKNASESLSNDIIPVMEKLANTSLPKVGGLGTAIASAFTGRNFELKDLGGQLATLGDGLGGLGQGLSVGGWADNNGVENAFDSLDSVFSLMTKIQLFYKELEKDGLNGTTAFAAFTNLTDFISYLVNTPGISNKDKTTVPIIEQISEIMKQVDAELTSWTDENDDTLDRVYKRMDMFRMFAEGLNALVVTDTTNFAFKFKSIGENIASGIAEGIRNGTDVIIEAGVMAIGELINAVNRAAMIKSPSRLFMTSGEYMSEGMAIGFENNIPMSENAAVEAVDSTSKALNKAMTKYELTLAAFDLLTRGNRIAGIENSPIANSVSGTLGAISVAFADEANNTAPTITPVLDLTQAEKELAAFKMSLKEHQLEVKVSAQMAGSLGANGENRSEAYKPDYTGIYERMNALGEQINQMGESIKQMRIVMDSGVVAGAVVDDVDRMLGRRRFYSNRMN